MAIRNEPCDWPIYTECCTKVWEAAGETQREFARRVATEVIWRLTGRRFGLCELTVRPCRVSCDQPVLQGWPPAPSTPWWPVLSGGDWINAACGSCRNGCSCSELCEIRLPGPVHDVAEVRVGAEIVDTDLYRVDDHRLLVRLDDDCWPDCQDLAAPPGTDGAFTVTYRLGVEVPAAGQYAAGQYACEILKSCMGQPCRLPARVQNITREGVNMTFLDPGDFLESGRTGVLEADVWIKAVNPRQLAQPARVYSPDAARPRTTTWP